MANPYAALFDALTTALADDVAGPFGAAGRVLLWADDGIDDLAPDEELRALLSRPHPQCLICWSGSDMTRDAGGGNAMTENVGFAVRFGCGVPPGQGVDYDRALRGVSGAYAGAWDIYEFVLNTVLQVTAGDYNAPPHASSCSPIRLGEKRLAFCLRFVMPRTRQYEVS